MKVKTLNSEYIVSDNKLWRNGELYTDDVRYVGGMSNGWRDMYEGTPKVGDMLYIEYCKGTTRSLRTSTITEVSDDY